LCDFLPLIFVKRDIAKIYKKKLDNFVQILYTYIIVYSWLTIKSISWEVIGYENRR